MAFTTYIAAYQAVHLTLTNDMGYSEHDVAKYLKSPEGINVIAKGLERHLGANPSERIESIGLHRNVIRCLIRSRYRIKTVSEVERLTDTEIRGINGIGEVSLTHIRTTVKAFRS